VDVLIAGLNEQLADLKRDPWELMSWLKLLPFSNRPRATLDALALVQSADCKFQAAREQQLLRVQQFFRFDQLPVGNVPGNDAPAPRLVRSGRLYSLLEALHEAPDRQCEEILAELYRLDTGVSEESQWGEALLGRQTLSGILLLIDTVRRAQALPALRYLVPRSPGSSPAYDHHIWGIRDFDLKVAPFVRDNSEVKAEILRQYEDERDGLVTNVLEAILAELGDPEALMAIIHNYSAHSRSSILRFESYQAALSSL
jgi:hypothetical protein